MSDRLFQHALRDWLDDGSDRTPQPAIDAVLLAVKTTRQERDLRIPWRFFNVPALSRATGVAAVALVAVVGAGGIMYLSGSQKPPAPSTGPTAAPTTAATTAPTPRPTAGAYVPPPLSATFTSRVHGITVSYPAGWTADAATEPWTTDGEPLFSGRDGDDLYDSSLGDNLILSLASQPLGDKSFETWSTGRFGGECTGIEPVVIDGADAFRCGLFALVSSGGRGYVIILRKSDDRAELRAFDASDWFTEILATVRLEPDEAVDG